MMCLAIVFYTTSGKVRVMEKTVNTPYLAQWVGNTDFAPIEVRIQKIELEEKSTIRFDSSTSCENSEFNTTFLRILNAYRVANGLHSLKIEIDLNLAACDHAKWMNETSNFSHSGIYGSSPIDRCKSRGVYCDAENVALSYPDNTPKKMFDLYKKSPAHNANMLGEHTVVGIAWAGMYNVCDFR